MAKTRETEEAVILNLKDAYFLLALAVRYALGRRTYIVADTCDQVRAIAPKLEHQQHAALIEEIERCKDYGDDCDKRDWLSVLTWLKSELPRFETSTPAEAVITISQRDAYLFLVSAIRCTLGSGEYRNDEHTREQIRNQVRTIAPKLTPAQRGVLIRDVGNWQEWGWIDWSLLEWLKSQPHVLSL